MQVFKTHSVLTSAVVGLCFTRDGRGLVTSSSAGVTLWDLTGAPTAVRRFDSGSYYTTPVAASPCGRFIAFGEVGGLKVFDLNDERPKPVFETPLTHTATFAPDGTELAAAGFRPRQWEVPSWKLIRAEPPPSNPRPGDPFCTRAIAYTPDSRTIALSFAVMSEYEDRYNSHFVLFDRESGELTSEIPTTFGHAHPTQIAFSPDGKVVAGNFGPVLGVTSLADGEEVARIKTGTKHITGLCFTPDGSKLVTVGNDTRVRVFDAHTWKETTGYEWKVGKLRCVAVAPDGLRMAAGSGTGKVVVWDVDA